MSSFKTQLLREFAVFWESKTSFQYYELDDIPLHLWIFFSEFPQSSIPFNTTPPSITFDSQMPSRKLTKT